MIFEPPKAVLFIFLIICLLLSGCTENPKGPEVTTQPTNSLRTPVPELANKSKTIAPTYTITPTPTQTLEPHLSVQTEQLTGTEITFWNPWIGETSTRLNAIIKDFNQSNEWGIKVQAVSHYSAGTLYDSVIAGMKEDPTQLPDVVAAPSEQLAVWSEEYSGLVPLDDYINLLSIGLSRAEIEGFPEIFLNQDRVNESQIGLPLLRTAYVLFYNQTWAKELGFESPPKTPAEFKDQACAAAVKNNTAKVLDLYGTGGWIVDTSSITLMSWIQSFGGDISIDQKSQGYTFESPESQEAVAFVRGMLDEGCAWMIRTQSPHNYFASRKALFYSGTLQDIAIQKRNQELHGSTDQWTILPYPRKDRTGFVYTSGYSLAIVKKNNPDDPSKGFQKQMAAWLFIRWLSTPSNQATLAEVLPSLPVNSESENLFGQTEFPWPTIVSLSKNVISAPTIASWRSVRRLVDDAGWQVFHSPTDQIKTILPQLDASIKEMIQEKNN